MPTRVHETIELDVMPTRRDTRSSSSTGHSSSSKDTDPTIVPSRKKISRKANEDVQTERDTPGLTAKVTAWACPVWITFIFSLISCYARWNLDGGPNMVMAKVTFSQALAGTLGGGATYLGVFYTSPGKYDLCVPVADRAFYTEYKNWYDQHRRPITPAAWMTNNTKLTLLDPPLPDYHYEDNQRVKRMIEAKNNANVPDQPSVPTVSSVTSEFTEYAEYTEFTEFTEYTSTPQVPTISTDRSAATSRPLTPALPQANTAGPHLTAGTGPTPPPAPVLHGDAKSAYGPAHTTETAPDDSVATAMLPTCSEGGIFNSLNNFSFYIAF